jgi:hypothetical protein
LEILEYPFIWYWCGDAWLEDIADRLCLRDDPRLVHSARVVFAPQGPTGHEPAVADAIMTALGAWDECLLWATRWGVWPSSEDWPRYYDLRRRHGSRMSIDDAPGHLASAGEHDAMREVLLQVLENGWDAVMLITRGGEMAPIRVLLSHDGYATVSSADPVDLSVPGLTVEK